MKLCQLQIFEKIQIFDQVFSKEVCRNGRVETDVLWKMQFSALESLRLAHPFDMRITIVEALNFNM